jgi:hypothetical protein
LIIRRVHFCLDREEEEEEEEEEEVEVYTSVPLLQLLLVKVRRLDQLVQLLRGELRLSALVSSCHPISSPSSCHCHCHCRRNDPIHNQESSHAMQSDADKEGSLARSVE